MWVLGFRHARYNDISFNEVHDSMELLGDGNGIYVSGAGVGNRLYRNYVHDISGQGTVSAIRLDDEQFHTVVAENVVFRMCAAGILTKNINQIENNFVVDCYGPRGYGYLSARHRGPCYGTGIRRNILLRTGGRSDKEPFWVLGDAIGFLSQVMIDDILLWDTDNPDAATAAADELRKIGKGTRNLVANPGFVDPGACDLRFADPEAARQLGIQPIDHWGPRRPPGPKLSV